MAKQPHKRSTLSTPQLQRLFKTPSVQYVFVAHNAPHRAIVVSNRSGKYELYAVDFSSGFHRQITRKKDGTLFGSISSNGQCVYWLNDSAGEEHGNFVRAPFGSGKPINITPNLRPYFSYSVNSSDDEKKLCFTAALDGKNRVFSVETKKDDVRETREVYSSRFRLTDAVTSPDGRYVCVAESNAQAKQDSLILLSAKNDARAIRSQKFESALPLSFSRVSRDPAVLAFVRLGEWLRPVVYNFAKKSFVEIRHSSFRGDVWVLRWDEDKEEMIVCDAYQAEQRLYRYNVRTQKLQRIGPRTGSFNVHFNSVARLSDGSLILPWNDFNTSPRLIRIAAPRYGRWDEIAQWSGTMKTQFKAKKVLVRSSDGESVQMWVAHGAEGKKRMPFVIDIHGGPHGAVGDEFSPEAQAWLSSGFGYCAVNYRGSTGFGKKFERKIYGNPGHWEVEDVVAAREWLVRSGHADPENIILHGWSWGGYVALLALGKYPKIWSHCIACAAMTDCIAQYEDEPAYFKAQDREMFGGTPKTARLRYVRSSPITYADRIQKPVLLLHGKNDARCPPRQIRDFVKRLKKLDKAVFVEWLESGHTGGFTNISLRTKLMDTILRFVSE